MYDRNLKKNTLIFICAATHNFFAYFRDFNEYCTSISEKRYIFRQKR